MWSEGRKVAVALSFDFDAESLWFETFKQPTPSPLSRGEYGARVGIWKVLDLLDRYSIPATFFIPAWTAETYPDQCQEIARRGHEVGYHGYYHESVVGMRPEKERDLMERGMAVLERVTGQRPRGNRSVPFDLGANTPTLLQELGFTYDSSLMGADNVEEIWRQEFDGAYAEGGLYLLTMHPQIIGRRSRIAMLERLIRDINTRERVWWCTHLQAAEDWLAGRKE